MIKMRAKAGPRLGDLPETGRTTGARVGIIAALQLILAVAFVTFVGLSTYEASAGWLESAAIAADSLQRDLLDSTLSFAALN